jgi:trigger factor
VNETDRAAGQAELDVAIEEPGGLRRRLTITVPEPRVTAARATERAKLAKSLRLKGFRRGKVPADVVERRYGPLVDERTVQHLVDEAYHQAIEERELHPVGDPAVEDVDYRSGHSLTFRVEFEVMPELKLARLGGFRVKRPEVAVSADEVERLLERVREEQAEWVPAKRKPDTGDLVVVRLGPVDESDEPLEDPKLYRLELGGGYALPGIEEAIRTLAPGETGAFDVRFPDDFEDEARAGSEQRLGIELVELQEKRLPPLDDELAREVGDFEDLQALERAVRSDLERHAEREAQASVNDQILDAIIEANPFDVPEATVERYLSRLIEAPEDADPERVEEARRSLRPMAIRQIKRHLVLDRIIETEQLAATAEEVEARVAEIAEARGVEARKLRSQLRRGGELAELERQLAVDKALDLLRSMSSID